VHFDYGGPVFLGVDYSGISYDVVDFSLRIPYRPGMQGIEIYHGDQLLYSRVLPEWHMVYLPLMERER
jgi:hypothetical protein